MGEWTQLWHAYTGRRSRPRYVGDVTARDEAEALVQAVQVYGLRPHLRALHVIPDLSKGDER